MAKRVVLTEDGPACPKCGSKSFRPRGLLEFGSGQMVCVGCGTGLEPASRRDVKAARKGR